MHARNFRRWRVLLLTTAVCLAPDGAAAHCDSLEGPVVQDARVALDTGDPTPVLKWVSKDHEAEVREAFQQTIAVRAKGDEAKTVADRYFFETLVRIHRAGEGEGFTGLEPASSVEPGIAAAEAALRSGSATELAQHMSAAVGEGIKKRLAVVLERKKDMGQSVEAGRAYVAAYVDYIHFVENLDRLVSHGAPHQHHEAAAHDGEH